MESRPMIVDFSKLDRLTDDQFFALCAGNRNLRIERNANGTITFMSPAGSESSDLCAEVIADLKVWARTIPNCLATESSGGFKLPDGSIMSPDIAWVSAFRLVGISQKDRKKFTPACPNFVVEILSPSDSLRQLKTKMQGWLQNGVELGWLINPRNTTVEIFEMDKPSQMVKGFASILSGEPYLPGFSFDLKLLRR